MKSNSHIFTIIMMLIASFVMYADIVHLKSGGRIEGRITDQGNIIEVQTRTGIISVYKKNIQEIESKPVDEDIFADKLNRAIKAVSVNDCINLADWAFKRDMNREYIQALRTALLIDPDNPDARTKLRKYRLHYSSIPLNHNAQTKLLNDFNDSYQILTSKHFRICYNTSEAFAEQTSDQLEKLYAEFLYYFESRNFEPAPLYDRLEVVLFDTPEQFRKHASRIAPAMAHSTGFFSSKTGRSYFYDSSSVNNKDVNKFHQQLSAEKQKTLQSRQQIEENKDPRAQYIFTDQDGNEKKLNRRQALAELDEHLRRLNQESQRLIGVTENKNITVTIHEGTHQLAYMCGIHNRYFNTPQWLIEGLATFFEATNNGRWDRPGRTNQPRLTAYHEGSYPGKDIQLHSLLINDKLLTKDADQSKASYSAAWALFYYLQRRHHEKFFDYIFELSLKMSPDQYSDRDRIKDFERYFGPVEQVEKDWHSFMNRLN